MHAFLLSVGIVFLAELADKSQLMALAFATRYRALPLLVGVAVAAALVHGVSVVIGAAVGLALPSGLVKTAAGVSFLGFAVWTLRGDDRPEHEPARARRSTTSAVAAASTAFFLAELGDKTMLATVTLATRQGLLGTWAGSTLGMVLADGLAILAGRQLGSRLPERAVRLGAAAAFALFGLALLAQGIGS